MAEPARRLSDDENPEEQVARPELRAIEGGGETSNPRSGHLHSVGDEGTSQIYDDKPVSAQDRANERWGMSPDELKDQEESGNNPEKSKADKTEGDSLDKHENQIGDGYKHDKPGGLKRIAGQITGLSTRKKVIGGGIIGLGVGGAFFMFSTFQGYAQWMQFSNLLQRFHFSNNEEFSTTRTGKYLWRRTRVGAGYAKMQSRLGAHGTRVANNMEARLNQRGFQSLYDVKTGNLIGLQFIGAEDYGINALIDSGYEGKDINIRQANDFPEAVGYKGAPKGSGRVLDLQDEALGNIRERFKVRYKISKALASTLGLNKIAAANGFRKTAVRGGFPLHFARRADGVLNEYTANKYKAFKEQLKEKWRERIGNGETPEINIKSQDKDGKTVPESEVAENEVKQTQAKAKTGDTSEVKAETKGKLAKTVGVGTVGIGLLCAARGISSNVDEVKHANIILPLMRMGASVVSTGAQVAASFGSPNGADLDIDQLGVLSENLFDESKNLGWDSARSIQAELGEEPSGPDIPPTAKPSRATEKPAVLNVVDSIFDKAGVGGDFACSRVGQLALDAVTGGLIQGVVSEVVGSVASAAGVNPLDTFVGWIVDTLAGEMVNLDAVGPDLGNIANYGARLAASAQAVAMGGAKLSPWEVAQLDAESKATQDSEFQRKSLFAKMFDVNEPKSVISKGVVENQRFASLQGAFGGSVTSLTNSFANFGTGFAKLLTPSKVKAATASNYDYGFDEYGFTLAEQTDERFDDPYENADIVENRIGLKHLVDTYGPCFSTNINPETGDIEGDEISRFDKIPDMCADRNNEELVRYRFYIADTMNIFSLECFDGDNSACAQVGIGQTSTTSGGLADNGTGGIGKAIDGFVFPLKTSKSVVKNNSPTWCYTSQTNCHHDYNAADIFAPTGTVVVAVRPGTVIKEAYSDTGRGHRVQIKGDDGNIYFYNHMSKDSPPRAGIRLGVRVNAGQPIGAIGVDQEAEGTPHHLHFDILPPPYQYRISCTNAECPSHPFINVQPSLIASFNNLPE